MRIRYGSHWLASGGVESAGSVTFAGRQVNDEIQFWRALSTTLFARGGRSGDFTFSVTRRFDTPYAAQRFAAEHFDAIPQQDDLLVWIGTDDDGAWVVFEDAVIDNFAARPTGTTAQIEYSFRVTRPLFDEPPPTVTEPDSDMIKRGTAAVASGESEVDVTFSVPFAGAPVVVAGVLAPDSGAHLTCDVVDGTVTNTGFTARLSAAAPGAGYKVTWIASA